VQESLLRYHGDLIVYLSEFLSNSSLRDSSSLLAIADADNAFPVIVHKITRSEREHTVSSTNSAYKFKNCRVACSPCFDVALMITRSGSVKVINCNMEERSWYVKEMSEQVDMSKGHWRECSVAFSQDGTRGIVLDWRGRMMFIDLD
jgi:hypothetical protein